MGTLRNPPNRQGSNMTGTLAPAPRPGPAPPCPPCVDQSWVVQYDRGRQVAPYRLPHDHTYRVGPRLQPSPDRGSAGGGRGEIMVAAAAETPSTRLSPVAEAFVPQSPDARCGGGGGVLELHWPHTHAAYTSPLVSCGWQAHSHFSWARRPIWDGFWDCQPRSGLEGQWCI